MCIAGYCLNVSFKVGGSSLLNKISRPTYQFILPVISSNVPENIIYIKLAGETGTSCYRGRFLQGRFMQNNRIDGEIGDSSYIRLHQRNH